MGLLSTVSRTVQRIVVGDSQRERPKEYPAMRMIITEEPGPTPHQQIRNWVNGGEAPDRAVRIHQQISKLHHADYLSFPEGEGVLGVYRGRGINRDPHNLDIFYNERIIGGAKGRTRRRRS